MAQTDLEKRWEQAGLTDDFIFSKVFLDPVIAREMIHRVLPELPLGKVTILNSQQKLTSTYDAKGVRFDIYAEDEDGNHYDVEMQVVNHQNLPQRTRFYQSNLANDAFERGQNYSQADNAYVIFFCCFDPFGLGEQRYEIKRRVSKYPDYPYHDGETTLFFDITNLRQTVGPKLQNFLDLLAGRKVDGTDDFIVQLRQRIAHVKQDRKWRKEYMQRTLYEMDIENDRRRAVLEGRKEGRQEGHQKGLQEGRQEGREKGLQEGRQEGRSEGVDEERLALVRDLINSGQDEQQVENFLVNIRKITPAKAKAYYQKVSASLK